MLAYHELSDQHQRIPLPTGTAEHTLWQAAVAKVKPVISLSLSDERLELVREVEMAREKWETTQNIFQQQTLPDHFNAKSKLYSLKMATKKRVIHYINCE